MLENWALIAASALVLVIAGFGLVHAAGSTARFRLRRAMKVLAGKRKLLRDALRRVSDAERTVEKFGRRADKVKPRHLSDSREALEDARALAKIVHDQLLIAENHVRRIIVEEFPPAKQQRLRAKYRVEAEPDRKPFTF